jgi:oligopeptide/dipeptide ABC transporter ATP-binding protein
MIGQALMERNDMSSEQGASAAPARVRPVLDISGLTLSVPKSGTVLVRNVDLTVAPGEVRGLVGETGAGKSLTAWSVLGLLPKGIHRSAGSIVLDGVDLAELEEQKLRRVRGRDVAIIVQNPRRALVPTMTVGSQLALVYRVRTGASHRKSMAVALEALAGVKIPNAAQRASDYPHQLSGGQAQRVVIAMALLNSPKLIIADEATTGLDVTVQSEILDLLLDKAAATDTALLLITHDLGVVANYTDTTTVMFAGEVIESGPTASVFAAPAHPYMTGLLQAADLRADQAGAGHLRIAGPPPKLSARPDGCQFGYRCPWRREDCAAPVPLRLIEEPHQVRCVRTDELDSQEAR